MSLSYVVTHPVVVERIKALRPKMPRKLSVPLLVPPRTSRPQLVGIAFDYLLRFELQRRAPHCVTRSWVAEHAPELLLEAHEGWGELKVSAAVGSPVSGPPAGGFKKAARNAERVLDQAREAVAKYQRIATPTAELQREVATHAVRLAKLDLVYRAHTLDPRFAEADGEDVEDILAMLAVVPFDVLLHAKTMLLNPICGESSHVVGGADPDLICGDMLIDVKSVKRGEIRADSLDQLLGYYLLTRRERRTDPSFPEIRRLALYFSRHAHLWVADATEWTQHPEFADIEEWFFVQAKEILADDDDSESADEE